MGLRGSKPIEEQQTASPAGPSTQPSEHFYTEESDITYLEEPFTKLKPEWKLKGQQNPEWSCDEFKWDAPLKLKSVNHIAIEANDVDKIARFYCDVLGFERLPRPDLGFPGHWLSGIGIMIHIILMDPSVPLKIRNWKDEYTGPQEPESWYIRRRSHLAFEVEDLEETEHLLRTHGVEYSRFVLPEANIQQLFLWDPEGNGIEIGVYDDVRSFLKDNGVTPNF